MAGDDLPEPPAFAAVEAWAGTGPVLRPAGPELATWQLPEPQKTALITSGIPLIDDLVEDVFFGEASAGYRLASSGDDVYRATPGTGEVLAWAPDGSRRFVNSSINHWLC